MAVEIAPAPAPVQDQPQKGELNGQSAVNGDAAIVENGQAGVEQSNGQIVPELELHRACVEGQLDEVRAVLSRGLEQLEALGTCNSSMSTYQCQQKR